MTQRVLVDAPDLAPGIGVDDDGRIFGGIDLRGADGAHGVPDADVMMMMVAHPRLGGIRRKREDGGRQAQACGKRRQTRQAETQFT